MTLSRVFAQAGEELALVGGPVRDAFLGRPVNDLDFTTSARPERTAEILRSVASKTWLVGSAFGTVAAVVAGEKVEVTTYRADVYRDDSRKPVVTFSDSLEQDLVRRDFTVNALALRLPQLQLVDVGSGVEDLMAGVLRTPGSSDVSFSDDPLRMMRAARFAAVLGFVVEEGTFASMSRLSARLEIVSRERVRDELVKLLCADVPEPGIRVLVAAGIMGRVLPELTALLSTADEHGRHKDVYEHSLQVLRQAIDIERERAGVGARPDVVLRLAALLHDIGKPRTRRFERGRVTFHHHDVVGAKLAVARLTALRFDGDTVRRVSKLIELHMRFFGYGDSCWSDSAVRRYVRDAGGELSRLHILTRADVTTRNRRKALWLEHAYDDIERRIAELEECERLDALRPELDGEQIMRVLGISPGREVGAAYRFLLELRLEHGLLGVEEAQARLLEWWRARVG